MTTIAKVRISNILGIDELEFDAGRFNQISGPNGAGKTSILEAIRCALKGGHDATLLRSGAESGEAVIVLDDGTEITKRVKADASATVVKDAEGKRVGRPAEAIKALTDMISINPVDFLRASKKERVSVLLDSLPIEIDAKRIQKVVGEGRSVPTAGHALTIIDALRAEIFGDRTGVNRAIKEKHATISQLSATLPDEADGEVFSLDGILAQIENHDKKRDAELARIENKLAGLRAESEARIEALRQQIADEQRAFGDVQAAAHRQRELTIKNHSDATAELRTTATEVQAAQKQAARNEATRQNITSMRSDADRLQAEADGYTAAIDELDSYKVELLGSLPIDGLQVSDGEILRNGVIFDRLNTAQQVEIAVEIARLRAGSLGVICVDGLELLDAERFEEFKQQAIASGLQMFVTRVASGEFSISKE